MTFIDLRSDTVTQPTPEMREAMARAEVGDDVFVEDPTVNRLQEMAAAQLGKEAALFVPSGTMGNQICLRLHTQPGQEIVVEERSHIFNAELAAMAAISGLMVRPVRGEDGSGRRVSRFLHADPVPRPQQRGGDQAKAPGDAAGHHELAGGTMNAPAAPQVTGQGGAQAGVALRIVDHVAVQVGHLLQTA